MAKYHITKKGEPGVCRAAHSCPLGGADEHFDNPKAAAQAYEQKMTEQLMPAGMKKDDLGLASLNKLAKVSSDREVLEAAVQRGSDRTFKSLSTNSEAPGDLLVAAHAKAGDESVKDALLVHKNYPVASMSGSDFARAYKLRQKEGSWATDPLISSDGFSDDHLSALQADPPKDYTGRTLTVTASSAVRNPNNKLSLEKRVELAEVSYSNVGAAQKSGLYPADRIADLPEDKVYWGNVYSEENSAYVDGYGDWAVKHQESHQAADIARHVANNPKASSETLDRIARAGMASQEVYKNPNTSDATKDLLAKTDATAASLRKIEKLEAERGDDFRKSLMKPDDGGGTVHPYGRYRGYSTTTVNFDPAKVKEAGLTAADVHVLMDSRRFNAGARYDEATGVFTGSVDSTD